MKIVVSASDGRSLIDFRGCLVKDLVARGHEVVCLSIEPPEIMADAVAELGATYRMVPMSRTGTNVLSDLKTMRAYRKALTEIAPDHYFAFMSKPVAYGGHAAVKCRIPHINVLINGLEIAFYSGGLKNKLVRTVLTFLYKRVHRHCDNLFFQNPDDYHTFEELGLANKQNSTIVHGSGVDMEHYARVPLANAPVFLMAARLVWSKGIREYLAAARLVKEQIPEARFVLVGRLDENSEALTKAELAEFVDAGIVEHLGFSEDVRKQISEASVFVLPSYHEGTPRSVLEAMSMGRAIITTDAPGCRETVVDGENGYLVPVGDHLLLAERMIDLAEDAELREQMGEASYRRCAALFEVHDVNRAMIEKMGL